LGATNRPDIIDEALLRPGRFDSLVYVDPPDREGRLKILKIHTKKMPIADDVPAYLELIANNTEGYSGADLENLAREAGMNAIREKGGNLDTIDRVHFETAFNSSVPSISEDLIKSYEKISKRLKKREIKLNLEYLT